MSPAPVFGIVHPGHTGTADGTPTGAVEEARGAGHDILLKIEVQGAALVRKRAPDALFIFIAPPSKEELVSRQQLREGGAPDEDIAERLKIAETEMKHAVEYNHVVVNDDLERAVAEVLEIVRRASERQT